MAAAAAAAAARATAAAPGTAGSASRGGSCSAESARAPPSLAGRDAAGAQRSRARRAARSMLTEISIYRLLYYYQNYSTVQYCIYCTVLYTVYRYCTVQYSTSTVYNIQYCTIMYCIRSRYSIILYKPSLVARRATRRRAVGFLFLILIFDSLKMSATALFNGEVLMPYSSSAPALPGKKPPAPAQQQQQQQQQAQQQAQQQQASTWEWNAPGGGKVREHKELSH